MLGLTQADSHSLYRVIFRQREASELLDPAFVALRNLPTQIGRMVRSHELTAQHVKMRAWNPKVMACLNFKTPFKSSKLQGLGPYIYVGIEAPGSYPIL